MSALIRTALRAPARALVRPTASRSLMVSAARWQQDSWAKEGNMSFQEFNKHVRQPSDDVLMIDTREPDEAAVSPIPGTVNLPFSKLASALAESTNPGQFQNDFAFPKPTHNQRIVFLDRASKRSDAAAEAAKKAGYANVRTYGGGVKEYQENASKHHE